MRSLLLLTVLGVLSCGGANDEPAPRERAATAVRAPDGSLRVPFLGGAFVTKSPAMPVEMEQAIAGEVPDRPVVVMAAF
jgi:hypothetical protein